ncbi:MAG: TRAP transporter large permease subunit [Phyllobacteriaceae bacterium]|nr:TRAP transporter large permease subunit [Phyllobacteriaceae bacterium]
MNTLTTLVLIGSFFVLVFTGVPIAFSLGIAAIAAGCMILPPEIILTIVSQRLVSGLDNFALLAIPFFVLAGVLMNHGGIAARLIRLALVIVGRTPGSLGHVNIVANMLFGAISGSASAAAAAVGGVMAPMQEKAGFPKEYSAAVNISSCVTGLLIPPSNVMIIYAVTAGNLSIAALFAAGYVPGILLGLSLIVTGLIISIRRGYGSGERATLAQVWRALVEAVPSLLLIIIIIGGIIGGVFTATEASAIAVLYALFLSVIVYRTIPLRRLPAVFLEATTTTAVVLLLVAMSIGMSWVMTRADIPQTITAGLLSISHDPIVLLLIINAILIVVGIFMDMTPAILIFTPIFLPVANSIGMDPLHFGIMMIFNLCIGLCTPPVGVALFVGCSVAGVRVQNVVMPLMPFFLAMLVSLALVTAVPDLSLAVPRSLGLYQ